MISLEKYKNICLHKNKSGYTHYEDGQFIVIDLGNDDEVLMEVVYHLGVMANQEMNQLCYIFKEHFQYIEIIYQLMKKETFILAIDGMCGAGKSTLANLIQKITGAIVFHMDDFYLPAIKRTQERLTQPGGNLDYERFIETVLKPISLKQSIYYQPFLCSCMDLSHEITVIEYHQKIIIEGSYSLRPELIPYYTDMVALRIKPELQRQRLLKRNPNLIKQFEEKWIPLENKYFHYYHIFEEYKVIDID